MVEFTGYSAENCCNTITGIEYSGGSSDNYVVSVDLADQASKDFNALTVNAIEGYGNWSSGGQDVISALDAWRYVTKLTWEVDFQINEHDDYLTLRAKRRRTILKFIL